MLKAVWPTAKTQKQPGLPVIRHRFSESLSVLMTEHPRADLKWSFRGFPGGPAVVLARQRTWVRSLFGELRSHVP